MRVTVRARRSAFTLLEMLIVVAVIGVLATLLMGALSKAKERSQKAACRAHINAIKSGLSMYESDVGRYPRLRPRPGTTASATDLDDDAGALYMGLMNKATAQLGGGPNTPYLQDWKPEHIGLVMDATRFNAGTMGFDPGSWGGGPYPTGVERLGPNDQAQVRNAAYQQMHIPPANQSIANGCLVLLDPWGNPFHYREWASIRNSTKDGLMQGPTMRTIVPLASIPVAMQTGQAPVEVQVPDMPHSAETFDIWSNGPNGVNEFGHPDSDDVSSWQER